MITDEVPTTSARPRTRTGKRGLLAFFALLGILVAAAVAGGIVPRLARQKALLASADSRAEQLPVVDAATARTALVSMAPTDCVFLDLNGTSTRSALC